MRQLTAGISGLRDWSARFAVLVMVAMCAAVVSCRADPAGQGFRAVGNLQVSIPKVAALDIGVARTEQRVTLNSLRGQYRWMASEPVPAGWPVADLYLRDELRWSQMEPRPGVYNFSALQKALERAGRSKGRVSFRVMAFCPGCGGNLTPVTVPRQRNGVPDWNSVGFKRSWKRLMSELGRRYDGDARIGHVDVGGYGAWGEWYHEGSYGDELSPANAKFLVQTALNAFPHHYVLVNWMQRYPEQLTPLSSRVGIRNDCLGGFVQEEISQVEVVRQVWKHAPIVSEWCNSKSTIMENGAASVRSLHVSMLSSGNMPKSYDALGQSEKQALLRANLEAGYRLAIARATLPGELRAGDESMITTRWRNDGSAPTYDDWHVQLVLQSQETSEQTIQLEDISLRTVLPGETEFQSRLRLPSEPARYEVSVRVVDPRGYLHPMRLANVAGRADGSYPLGVITIVG